MKTTYLDYYKMILDKVSFDSNLLLMEYEKAVLVLPSHEVTELTRWLNTKGLLTAHSASQNRAA
jgi:hypothetical protein